MAIQLHVCVPACALLAALSALSAGCADTGRVAGEDGGAGAGGGDAEPEERLEPVTFLPPQLPFYAPPHLDGDREFEGHGPDMTITVDLHVVDGDQVHAAVRIDAVETHWDWTSASGTADFLLHQTQDPIVSIDSPAHFEHRYRDTDHARDVFHFPEGDSLVKTLTCVGDTMGREAGAKTGCSAELHPITVTVSLAPED